MDQTVIKSNNEATPTRDENMEEEAEEDFYDEDMEDLEEDMDLDINDDDVKDFLKNLEESNQTGASEDSSVSNTQEESVEAKGGKDHGKGCLHPWCLLS